MKTGAAECVTLLLCLLFLQGAAKATEIYFQPRALFNTAVNDNRRLRLDPGPTVYRGLTDIRVQSHAISDTFYGLFAPRARISRFEGDSLLNSDEYFVEALADKIFERARVRIDGSFSDTATINSELDDGGRFGSNGKKRSYSVAPSYTYSYSPRLLFSVATSANKVEFNGESQSFVNYDFYSGSLGLTYQFSDRTSWNVSLARSIFITESNTRTETSSLMVGIEHALSDSVDVAYSIGPLKSEIRFVAQEFGLTPSGGFSIRNVKETVDSGGARIDIRLEKRFETGSFRATYNRDLQPSSIGEQNVTNIVRGVASWQFSPLVESVGTFMFRTQKSEADLRASSDRTTYFAEAMIRRRVTQNWRLALSYSHRRFIRVLGDAADANELSVSLIYDGGVAPVVHRR